MRLIALLMCLLAMATSGQASAQATDPLQQRAEQLVGILKAPGGEEAFFSPVFLEAVPVAQWRTLAEKLRDEYGAVEGLSRIAPTLATSASIEIRYERATVGVGLVVAPGPPHQVVGLRITGAKVRDDSPERLVAEFRALPGEAALSVQRLDDTGPHPLFGLTPDRQMATGSEFKLYILAELTRSISAGERLWSTVAPLSHKSFSGRLAGWPDDAPMTLHSLATAMIAESDNSAADTLLHLLGRDKVDAMVAATGHGDPDRTLPILSTTETFALKMPGAADLRTAYVKGDLGARRRLLRDHADRLGREAVDAGQVSDRPVDINEVEWFASPDDMVRLLDWLRRNGALALPIMAVNPGIGAGDAARWRYLGYKGGSEPGVIAMSFLALAKDGRWYAVSGSWNDAAATVDNDRFTSLMARVLNVIAEGDVRVRPSAPPPAP